MFGVFLMRLVVSSMILYAVNRDAPLSVMCQYHLSSDELVKNKQKMPLRLVVSDVGCRAFQQLLPCGLLNRFLSGRKA